MKTISRKRILVILVAIGLSIIVLGSLLTFVGMRQGRDLAGMAALRDDYRTCLIVVAGILFLALPWLSLRRILAARERADVRRADPEDAEEAGVQPPRRRFASKQHPGWEQF